MIDSHIKYIWAKLLKETYADGTPIYHPLIHHMIDVAKVAYMMWAEALPISLKNEISSYLGLDDDASRKLISFLVGIHDIGKASPVFETQVPAGKALIEKAGLGIPLVSKHCHHSVISAKVLTEILKSHGWAASLANRVAASVGGHHGTFPLPEERIRVGPQQLGKDDWNAVREELFNRLCSTLDIDGLCPLRNDITDNNVFFVELAGLTSVADWIGSAVDYFPFAKDEDWELDTYSVKAEKQAEYALKSLGWNCWQPDNKTKSFFELFGFDDIRPLQDSVLTLQDRLDGPSLVLIEAPMGEGKTEAALCLHEHFQAGGQKGCYIALPTQATTNQMFGRVKAFLSNRYPSERVNLHLMHGHAALSEEYKELKIAAISEEKEGTVVAEEWFTPKKRGLLSPFGVGTVDQALLSVLQVKHGFVRLLGLAHKTVIIDEVHAYDTYTSTLICRLLEWLSALGASVVLLSATLPKKKRIELLEAYSGVKIQDNDCPYPRISWVSKGRNGSESFGACPHPNLEILLVEPDKPKTAKKLIDAIADGGCAAWICNTVDAAQEVYSTLSEIADADTEVEIFHARFPWEERMDKESCALNAFGKHSLLKTDDPQYKPRPKKAILVATQVVEQSLDIDFDIMVTELAPVDLVLQRSGRIHRHNRERPARLKKPELWLIKPDINDEGIPDFGISSVVYSEYILLRSWLILSTLQRIESPGGIEESIEKVYSDKSAGSLPDPIRSRLKLLKESSELEEKNEQHEAETRLVASPRDKSDILSNFNKDLYEDSSDIHRSIQALTRLCEPSVNLICLYKTDNGISLDPKGSLPIDLESSPDSELVRQLMRRSVTLTQKEIVRHFLATQAPKGWKRIALLRNHRAAIFEDGICYAGSNTLRLDPEIGIVISETKGVGQ